MAARTRRGGGWGSVAGDAAHVRRRPDERGSECAVPGRLRRAHTGTDEQPERLSTAHLGHPGGDAGGRHPEAAQGQLLPGVAPPAAAARGAGTGGGGGGVLSRRRLHPARGGAGADAGHRVVVEVAGVGTGPQSGCDGERVPESAAGRGSLQLSLARCPHPEVPGGRAHRQRGDGRRDGRERRWPPRDPRSGCDHDRGWRRLDGVPARASG
jgi:hypothetical protein